MEPASIIRKSPAELERIVDTAKAEGIDLTADDVRQLMHGREVWRNDRYVVMVDRHPEGWVTVLSIRRDDRKPIRDWRHFQQIKNDIAGPTVEAVELYPAADRLVDTANQYWLWCLPPGELAPFGFTTALTAGASSAAAFGARQRDH
jgi:hypothetical protein